MPDVDLHQIPAEQRKLLLENMLNGPAFLLFCEKWDDHVRDHVEKKIFDPATSDNDTRQLKAVRAELTGTRHPRAIVQAMIRAVKNEKPKP